MGVTRILSETYPFLVYFKHGNLPPLTVVSIDFVGITTALVL